MSDLIKDSLAGGITAVASLSGNPIITVATAAGAPVISSVAVDYGSRALSNWQSSRFIIGCQLIAQKISLKIQSGKSFRMDGEMSPVNGEEAQQVLEGILQNISDEYEKKKIEAHANFFTNLCFEERIVFEQALYLSKIIKQLSYRQLVLIAIFHNSPREVENWIFQFEDYSVNNIFNSYADLYCEVKDLQQKVIIEDSNPIATFEGSPNNTFKLSVLGSIIYDELELSSIPEDDINKVSQMLVNNQCKI